MNFPRMNRNLGEIWLRKFPNYASLSILIFHAIDLLCFENNTPLVKLPFYKYIGFLRETLIKEVIILLLKKRAQLVKWCCAE